MSIQYSGSVATATLAPATKQNIIDQLGAILVGWGWTTKAGGSGTASWTLQSATTPQGFAIQIKMQDNGGSCVTFSLQSTDGVLVGPNSTTQGGAFLLPGYTYRVVGSGYQAFIWATPNPNASRTVAFFGVPYVESWLVSSISRAGWMQGNAATDTDTGVRVCFRSAPGNVASSAAIGAQQGMLNTVLWSHNSTSTGFWDGQVVFQSYITNFGNTAATAYRDIAGNSPALDALIFWGVLADNSEAKSPGQLWDAFVVAAPISGDQTGAAPDGHNYIVLTDNYAGTLLLATS